MSNYPIIPITPNGAGLVVGKTVDGEDELPENDANLDEGESNDSQDTVEEDVREADSVNEKLDE